MGAPLISSSRLRPLGLRALVVLTAMSMVVGGCSGDGADESTTSVEPSVTTSLADDDGGDGVVFRVGLTGPITTDNWFAAIDGPESTEANRAYLDNSKLALFSPSLPGFVNVPVLAATPEPVEPTEDGDGWVVEQPIREDVVWSDGTPVTAEDLVLYFDVVREFGLGTNHASHFAEAITDIEALDDHTVRIEFGQAPGLAGWDAGAALAPFIPSHYWRPHVDQARRAAEEAMAAVTPDVAREAIAAESLADGSEANDVAAEDVTDEAVEAYVADIGGETARSTLYGVSAIDEPSIGPVVLDRWVQGDAAIGVPNPNYFDIGSEKTLYTSGFRIANASRGEDEVYGGDGSGDVLAHYIEGPFFSEIQWIESETRQAAYEKLARGEVDYVYDSTSLTSGLRDQLAIDTSIRFSVGQAEGFRYMAFNLRKAPMSDVVFRTAVATLIDKELLADTVLGGAVFPAYTLIHPDLTAQHNADVERAGWSDGEPMTEEQRYASAIEMLSEAGYTWESEPVINYNESGGYINVTPGEGMIMPNGARVPELTLLAPGPTYDPYRATFSVWIGNWMSDLGIPIAVEQTDFDAIVDAAFPPQTPETALEWDLYMLGWGAPDVSLPGASVRAFFHSDQDSVLRGGFNTSGYGSDEFDSVADEFDAAVTLEEAALLTKEMEAILARDLPYIVLFRAAVIEAHNNRVQFPVDSIMGGQSGHPNGWPGAVVVGQ
ncbi:MAG: ABC transporter substrate-binding protein [Acidimicrobiia bacterium]|jgi:ABC-type transport system substrate-binding protein